MRRGLLLVLVPAALLLAGCAPTVSLQAAPQATSVGCAGVIVRLPGSIGGAALRSTDAQGTAAWGVPATVTLTCGVTTLRASSTKCQTIGDVDWLLGEQRIGKVEHQVLTTFGRTPTTQVVLDQDGPTAIAVLDALSDPVAAATRKNGVKCLAETDVPS